MHRFEQIEIYFRVIRERIKKVTRLILKQKISCATAVDWTEWLAVGNGSPDVCVV